MVTHASMPPTCWTSSKDPFKCLKYRIGAQYADLSWTTAHDVQSPLTRSSYVDASPKPAGKILLTGQSPLGRLRPG